MRIALVAATVDEARRVMVEGPSGLLACARAGEIAGWSPARRTLLFANGAEAVLYSGRSPEALRGPEHDFAWCDELAKWRHPAETWDMLQLGLRRGAFPRALVTTTPRHSAALSAILAAADTAQTGGSTRDNVYLSEAYVAAMEAQYGGTRLGAQEIEGVLLEDAEGSLWPRALIERCRVAGVAGPDALVRVVVGVDPPASAAGTCGIVVCALGADGVALVIEDASVAGRSPEGWAAAVAVAAERWAADRIVVEANQGGDMTAAVLRGAGRRLPVETVNARGGKTVRAEPVAALFERGEARFAGRFPALEAELNAMTAAGGTGGDSPDRADAMVWALWALMLKARPPEPRVRRI
jgi:phage terminase large subunit-like protein